MKARPTGHFVPAAANPVRHSNLILIHNPFKEKSQMSSKKQPVVRKPSKKIADSRRVRFGSGMAPATVRAKEPSTQDSGAIRFGSGMAPASLRK